MLTVRVLLTLTTMSYSKKPQKLPDIPTFYNIYSQFEKKKNVHGHTVTEPPFLYGEIIQIITLKLGFKSSKN